ncbi:MAG: aminotransferase [Actinomycetia bacterium]|nr:aminotransferase [Actinomycetes bacterium]
MKSYQKMNAAELQAELAVLQEAYDAFQARGLKLNMARGKPAPEQLDLSHGLLTALSGEMPLADANGEDTRNYGVLRGIPEARALMAELMGGLPPELLIIGNNSSLALMHDALARAVIYGVAGCQPWQHRLTVDFLCPAPGYDRHFAITAAMGINNIPVRMTAEGPDMDVVERLVSTNETIKGIWCVPKYSNPQGITYSDEVVRRFAALKPAAPDFRIYWDNAYAVHDLCPGAGDELLDLRRACEEAGNPDIWLMFASTSKITLAGAGISAIAASATNLAEIEKQMALQTIGADKINQLRHVRWFESLGGGPGLGMAGIRRHMAELAELIAPKFAVVQETLCRELQGLEVATWTEPRGGYFISLEGLPNTAKRTVALAKAAGVALTEAGATWPYGHDPRDRNIRIAPTYPSIDELGLASELLTLCVRLAAAESLLAAE